MRKFNLIALGCNKNLCDSEIMLKLLIDEGYAFSENISECDFVVINTCGFIESAKEEAIENIFEVASYREENPNLKILVAGCLAQRYKDEILDEIPEIDAAIGTGSVQSIVEAVQRIDRERVAIFGDIDAPLFEQERLLSTPFYTAFLKVAEGCSNACAYCVIPKIRGKYRSRRMEDIIAEAKRLVLSGVVELVLVAQDTTGYGRDLYQKPMLVPLIRELSKIDGLKSIRLHYLYPELIDDELISEIKENPLVEHYVDVPIQHISTRLLKKMRRRSTGDQIRALIDRLRDTIPDVVIRTSVIVGLPTETEEEFEELCQFLKSARLDRVGVFKYSPEEGSEAFNFPQLDEDVKDRRYEVLFDICQRNLDELNAERVGKRYKVLVEGYDPYAKLYFGRSYGEAPEVDGKIFMKSGVELEIGSFVFAQIFDVLDGDVVGEVVLN